jgi:hypothetical protein
VETAVSAVYDKTLDVEAAVGYVKSAVDAVKAMVARPAWYDRNPQSLTYDYNGANAQHTNTQRFYYVVPAGRKAIVESAAATVILQAQGTTAGLTYIQFKVTPNGGTVNSVARAILYPVASTSSLLDNQSLGQCITLFEGDMIECETYSGGNQTFYYWGSLKITEFDA